MRVLYILWQWTWGILQSLAGLCLFLGNRGRDHFLHRGAAATRWGRPGGVSLGMFVFIQDGLPAEQEEKLLAHEYGHTIQSLVLGPLYLFVIGIPSAVWAGLPALERRRRRKGISYYAFYTERWADRWGGVDRHG